MGPSRQKGASKLIIILIILVVLLMLGGAAGGLYLSGMIGGGDDGDARQTPAAPLVMDPIYKLIEPAITVNLSSSSQRSVLQARIQLMAREQRLLDAVEEHMPVVRNNLLLLFSGQDYDELSTREGKERLRDLALEEVNAVLEKMQVGGEIEAIYFTSFVMQ